MKNHTFTAKYSINPGRTKASPLACMHAALIKIKNRWARIPLPSICVCVYWRDEKKKIKTAKLEGNALLSCTLARCLFFFPRTLDFRVGYFVRVVRAMEAYFLALPACKMLIQPRSLTLWVCMCLWERLNTRRSKRWSIYMYTGLNLLKRKKNKKINSKGDDKLRARESLRCFFSDACNAAWCTSYARRIYYSLSLSLFLRAKCEEDGKQLLEASF